MTGEATYVALPSDGGGTSSLPGTISNIVKALLGAGLLTLSWAFCYSSLWAGVGQTLLLWALSMYSFFMLGACSESTGEASYSGIWRSVFGRKYAWMPDLVVLLFCSFTIISYLIIIGDYVPKGFAHLGLPVPSQLLGRRADVIVAALAVLPLNLLQDASFLGYTSIIGTSGALYVCGLLLFEVGEVGGDSDWEAFAMQPGLFVTMPTIAFAFNGHFGAPSLYQQLRDKSMARWRLATVCAFGTALPITLICGVTGYLMFGSSLVLPGRSNVLTAPALESKSEVIVGYLMTAVSVLLSIPIYTHSVRDSIEGLRKHFCGPDPASPWLLRSFSVGCTVATMAVALALTDLGLIVAINGSVTACLVMFVFPGLMYIQCYPKEAALAKLTVALGAGIGVAGVTTTLMLSMGLSSSLRW